MRAASSHARAHECVEQLALRQAQPCHDWDGKMREERCLIPDLRAPGDVAAETLAPLAGDLDALLARGLAEPLDRAFSCGLHGLGAGGRAYVRKGPVDPDFVFVHVDLCVYRGPIVCDAVRM